MKQPKFIATLALLLALLTLLSACGTYKPALRPTDTGEHESESELPTEAPPTRPEIPFTVVKEEGETYACYDFGKGLIYDPVSGVCRPDHGVIASQLSK